MEELRVELIEEAIEEYWGDRCDSYHAECACCMAWKQFDRLREGRDADAKT